jgi:O-acetyl-ADP-ribose deacetylase (regulator of RNase III)
MSNIRYVRGNIFDSSMMTIVNTVNTVGFMGAGIALEYMRRYPDMFEDYKKECFNGNFKVGDLGIWKNTSPWILNFPTKIHYQDPSKISYLAMGLNKFSTIYEQEGITSIAFPQLGSQLGGLSWEHDVQPLMIESLKDLDLEVEIYEFDRHADDKMYINLREILRTFTKKDYKNYLNLNSAVAERVEIAIDINIKSMGDFQHVKGLGKEALKKIYLLAKDDPNNYSSSIQQNLFEE